MSWLVCLQECQGLAPPRLSSTPTASTSRRVSEALAPGGPLMLLSRLTLCPPAHMRITQVTTSSPASVSNPISIKGGSFAGGGGLGLGRRSRSLLQQVGAW